jgi:type IV secretion system protein VirB4
MRPVALPNGDLGHFIPARRVSFGQDCVELGPTGQLARRFVALVSIKDYPGATFPGMFDELYRLPFELHVTQSFAMVERGAALAQMNLALAHAIGGRRGRLAAR